MSHFRLNLYILIIFTFGITSCVSTKKVIYLNNLSDTAYAGLRSAQINFETPIQKNDLLSIAIGGSNPEDLAILNSGSGVIPGASVAGGSSNSIGYLVESDGKIQLPYLGRVQAVGLTRLQLQEMLTKIFSDYTKNPVVNVKFMNYGYSVLGEVGRPGRFEMSDERITIFEALAMANDVTTLGKRDNVLVVREVNGQREFGRVNLLSKEIFNSPYFYLKTNDVVYVEPVRAKFFSRTGAPQYISIVAAGAALIITILNLAK